MDKDFPMIAGENPASVRFPERNDVPMVGFEYDREGRPLGFLVSQKKMRREQPIEIVG